jgi:hypothetical protein
VATPLDVATSHQQSRIRLANDTTQRALGSWRTADLDYLDASWNVIAPVLVDQVAEAQITAANQSVPYIDDSMASFGTTADDGDIAPEAFSGVMIDGRDIGPAMFGAVTTTKTLIGRGFAAARAFEAGAAFLSTIVQSAIADAGRQSDRVAAVAKNRVAYVRVLSPGACSRCAALAGKASAAQAFQRHPHCACTAMQLPNASSPVPKGFFGEGSDYFHSLSRDEQDRIFTNAGAEAIRNGADLQQVVNARRGAPLHPGGLVQKRSGLSAPLGYDGHGNPIKVHTTSEGATIRGAYGRAEFRRKQELTKGAGDRYRKTTNPRLMPETLAQMAGGDTAKFKRLLTQYGYIT